MHENKRTNFEVGQFQTEVKQLLDIVINSLYTEREIFLRELISNAADALERFRYESLLSKDNTGRAPQPLAITIDLDQEQHRISITDAGIGMTKEELIENLGTIAHSGSKKFVKQLTATREKDLNLIGQFGVGFYSAFMVAKKVRVLSRSYKPGSEGYEWISDGTGSYEIGPAEGLERGTKIILELKENAYEFTEPENIKRLIRQYSSFVPFPISVNNEAVNTVQAIWKRNKNEVSDEEYTEFYKYIANAYDAPFYRLHFSTDVPLSINALLFVPKQNFEQFGFGRVKPGVNLYCKKILIQQHSENILPEWLRFIKGVVDSEDIPLNISRETMQDSTLIKKLNKVITRRFLKFLTEKAETDPESYNEFWNIFGNYLKEGMASDFTYKEQLAKLLRFESSKSDPGKLISLNDYISRMKEEQKDIYFINGPTRQAIETGPYIEAFRALEYEVVYTHEPIDDFILSNLTEFEGKKLISADQAQLELPPIDNTLEIKPLDDETMNSLINWFKETLGDKVSEIKRSERLTESPAIMLNLDGMLTSSMQRAMQSVNKDLVNSGKKILEINPRHKLIQCLASLQKERPYLAKLIAEQIYDNALISSGLFVEPRIMVKRIYQLLEHVTSEN